MADVLTVEQSRIPDILRRTAPWVRLMAIVLFISSALMMIGGVVFAVGMAAGLAAGGAGHAGAAPALIGGVLYCGVGLINLIPAVFLNRFASRARDYVAAATVPNLEQALDAQRSYWKFMGIFMIVGLVVGVCVAVVAGIAGAMWMQRATG